MGTFSISVLIFLPVWVGTLLEKSNYKKRPSNGENRVLVPIDLRFASAHTPYYGTAHSADKPN